ncbi:DUF4349 domain-containing protein [Paenibacillus hamazuiensis]|uniref:DUF4349 domain-containing protein n=1 Tax=Paenibacillus hamazuiensis TaxID=2936508 RepID=UPI00200EEF54|nr:DUF4349 domain-containing protein [Paenibacillus hamazuiensis]
MENKTNARDERKRWRSAIPAALMVWMLLASALAGCGAGSGKSADQAANGASAIPEAAATSAAARDMNVADGKAKKDAEALQVQPAGGSVENKAAAASPGTADIGDGLSRKIMYRANLVVQTDDYAQARSKVQDVVALSGGYILQFSENTTSGEVGGTFTIKVPATGFISLLDQLEKISPSKQRSVQGQDVSEEYVDLQSRLKAKQVVESRLLAFMEKATKTDELLAFSNELAKVQEEIEKIKGRMRYIDQNVAMSTIELRLYQKAEAGVTLTPAGQTPFSKRIAAAFQFGTSAVSAVAQALAVFVAGAVPIAIILAVVGIPVWLYLRRRNRSLAQIRSELRRQTQAAEPLDTPETEK